MGSIVLKGLLLIWVMCVVAGVSMAETCKVGDEDGWTSAKNVSYDNWATARTFHVGDIILFNYNKTAENVLRVTKAHYKSCNSTRPLATYSSGNDSITLRRKGHFFFISGVADHCQHGLKLHVRVLNRTPPSSAAPAKPPSASAPPPSFVPAKPPTAPSQSPIAAPANAPTQNHAPAPSPSGSSSSSTVAASPMILLSLLAVTSLYLK